MLGLQLVNWVGLGDVLFLEKACHWGTMFEVSKASAILIVSYSLSLSHGGSQDVSCQLLPSTKSACLPVIMLPTMMDKNFTPLEL